PDMVLRPEDGRVLLGEGVNWPASFRIALVRQFPVTMNGVVAATLQFCADRGLACAGNAVDQVIASAHWFDHAPFARQRVQAPRLPTRRGSTGSDFPPRRKIHRYL